MEQLETTAFWSTVFIYMGAFILHVRSFSRGNDKGVRFAMGLLWAGLGANTILLGLHWMQTGHPPVLDPYELQLSAAWSTILIFLLLQKAGMIDRVLAMLIAPITFLLMGNAYASQTDISELGTLYATPWMVVHVTFAWITFANYALAAAAGILILFYGSFSRRFPDRLPTVERLDRTSYRLIVLGVVNQTMMLASGAIWAKRAWGHYWTWAPLEAWSLASYLLYIFYLHVRRFFGWEMKKTAWIAAFGLIILSISYWGMKWLAPTLKLGH